MFSLSTISDLKLHAPAPVTLEGFVDAVRHQGKIAFVQLRSRLTLLQCVVLQADLLDICASLSSESYVRVRGRSQLMPQAIHGIEIVADQLEVLAAAAPLPVDAQSDVHLKGQHPSARLRFAADLLPLLASAALEHGLRDWLATQDFVEIHTPKLMGAPSESGSEVFKLGYFGQTAYLAQSPQFYKQMAIIGGMGRVFEIGPVFRAEPSFSVRHATEFISVDIELEGERSAADLATLEYAMISYAFAELEAAHGSHLQQHFPQTLADSGPLEILTHAEVCRRLQLATDTVLTGAHERELGQQLQAQGVDFCAIVEVPWSQRPFYHRRQSSRPDLTESFELLYRGMEITTGAMREHRRDVLLAQLAEKGLSGAGAQGYLDSFQWGAPPHGGFGLGLARLVALRLGLPSIREATFLHRTPKSILP